MARIAVIGSAAQDDVVWLRQPLRAGRHLEGSPTEPRLGGGGLNTAIPLCHAGHHVALLAAVGDDATGEWLLGQARAAGVDVSAVVRVPAVPSTRSLVLVDPEGERTVVNFQRCREAGPPLRLRALSADAVYVRSRETDLGPLLAEQLERALVVAHLPPLDKGARPAHVLVGSESDLPDEVLADPWQAGRKIAGEPLRSVVLTRGARGASAFRPGGRLDAPAPASAVVDTTGAGDVFAAGLVHALLSGRPLEQALDLAVSWGSATVAVSGLPGPEAIRRLL